MEVLENVNPVQENLNPEDNDASNNEYVEIEIPFHLLQYLNMENSDVQNVCRICLSVNNEFMYQLLSDKDENILGRIYLALTDVQVTPEDGLPTFICLTCHSQIMNYYQFKEQCDKSNCILKSIIRGVLTITEDVPGIDSSAAPECQTSQEKIKIKSIDTNEDMVQYLEDSSDNEALCVLQNTKKDKENVEDTELIIADDEAYKNKGKSLKCQICSKKFVKMKNLKNHLNKNHQVAENSHLCTSCGESFNSEHDLNLHSALHTKGSPWKCTKCKKEFNTKSMLRRHLYRHMQCKRYSCSWCGKPFAELYALRRHARVHTGEVLPKKHQCHVCDKRFSELGQLLSHEARHAGLRPWSCSSCGKDFPSPRLLASHARVHSDDKPYACEYCSKRFRHESTRNTHHRTHTGEKPYICSVCAKTFIQSSNLILHMRTHTGEKPYTCTVCNNTFSSGSTLKAHARTHTGERPYQCNVCGKKFSRSNLRAHMSTHSGERPHACAVCHKRFLTASRMRDHARTHTGEKPFDCASCSQAFTTKSHLIRHIKSHKNGKLSDAKIKNKVKAKLKSLPNNNPPEATNENATPGSENNETDCRTIMFKAEEGPIEVSGELVLPDDSNVKTEVLVIDNSQNYQTGNILNTSEIIVSDVNYANNIVAVNDGETISTTNAVLEGATVKLYQLDQSLLQIHSSGGQLTIRKVTSKMTANF